MSISLEVSGAGKRVEFIGLVYREGAGGCQRPGTGPNAYDCGIGASIWHVVPGSLAIAFRENRRMASDALPLAGPAGTAWSRGFGVQSMPGMATTTSEGQTRGQAREQTHVQ